MTALGALGMTPAVVGFIVMALVGGAMVRQDGWSACAADLYRMQGETCCRRARSTRRETPKRIGARPWSSPGSSRAEALRACFEIPE